MKRQMLTCLCLCLLLMLTGCNKLKEANKNNYISYHQIPESYSLEDAKKDNCVVFDDLTLTSGEEVWEDFLEKTKKQQEAFIRIANYYAGTNMQEEVMFLSDVYYNGETYHYYYAYQDEEIDQDYLYLLHYQGDLNEEAIYSKYEQYVLTNDSSLTYEYIQHMWLSSQAVTWIDYQQIYCIFYD